VEDGAEEPGALVQLTYSEVLDRVAEQGDLFRTNLDDA
jgi:hypothetical protein